MKQSNITAKQRRHRKSEANNVWRNDGWNFPKVGAKYPKSSENASRINTQKK